MAAVAKIYARISECPELFGLSRATMYRGKDANRWNIYKVGGIALVKIAEVVEAIENQASPSTTHMGDQLGGQSKAENSTHNKIKDLSAK